jgi:hypothetical protein
MKRAIGILLVVICLSLVGWFVFAKRFQLAAEIWHWRYGHSVAIRDYQVPVPDGWLVWASGESDVAMTMPTGQGDQDFVSIGRTCCGSDHLDAWKEMQEHNLRGRGITDVREKTLQPAGETVVCIGHAGPHFSDFLSIECVSTGKLNALYFGRQAGLEDFYAIVSQVRKTGSPCGFAGRIVC